MKILKRSGAEAVFDINKIIAAVTKANQTVDLKNTLTAEQIQAIGKYVEGVCAALDRALSVEEIQDIVETQIMKAGAFEVAKKYITYRYVRSLVRQANSTDKQILTLIECNNEDIKQENSNKNPTVNSVQRDYMAGEVSKDIASRILLPREIIDAHNEGIIHFHDMDYYAQHMHNCDLVNLEDMLQNGTVISGTMIDRPRSFSTACNIATQIIAQDASNQYGGQSITLTHLAPFVDVSRRRIRTELIEELGEFGLTKKNLERIVEKRVREEIERGVQTIHVSWRGAQRARKIRPCNNNRGGFETALQGSQERVWHLHNARLPKINLCSGRRQYRAREPLLLFDGTRRKMHGQANGT